MKLAVIVNLHVQNKMCLNNLTSFIPALYHLLLASLEMTLKGLVTFKARMHKPASFV